MIKLVLKPYLSAKIHDGICPIEENIKNDEITIDNSESERPIYIMKIAKTPTVKVESLAIIAAPIFHLFEE